MSEWPGVLGLGCKLGMLLCRRLLSTAVLSSSIYPAAASMRILLIRHAQSQNNVIAREERSVPGRSRSEARAAFEKRRYEDPALSELGSAQAKALGYADLRLEPSTSRSTHLLLTPSGLELAQRVAGLRPAARAAVRRAHRGRLQPDAAHDADGATAARRLPGVARFH